MLTDKDIAKSRDVMLRLEEELGFTIGLAAVLHGTGYGRVLAAVDGTVGFSFHLEVDFEFPLHTSAPGKVLLAYLRKPEREACLNAMDFRKYTPGTIVNRENFMEEIESVLEKGYGLDVSEQLEGCHCVGVPVFDAERRVVAGLWATGPASLLPVRSFGQVSELLRKASAEICARISTHGRSQNRDYINNVVGQAQGIMKYNLNRPLDMEELANNLYVGYSWFRKVFKEQTGEAPAEYHRNRRIEKACELLKDGELSVRQISEELGFKTQNHFSALFKRKTGLSPRHYQHS